MRDINLYDDMGSFHWEEKYEGRKKEQNEGKKKKKKLSYAKVTYWKCHTCYSRLCRLFSYFFIYIRRRGLRRVNFEHVGEI